MKVLPVLILLSFSTFAYGDQCDGVASSLNKIEGQLLNEKTLDCSDQTFKSSFKSIDTELVCKPLGLVESEIGRLEAQEAFLIGFKKLKLDIERQKEKAAQSQNLKAAKSFTSSVTLAGMLDHFVNAPDMDGKPFLQALKAIPEEQRSDAQKLRDTVSTLCRKSVADARKPACDMDVGRYEVAFKELNDILKAELSTETIDTWKRSLSIKQVGSESPYSFSQMYDSIRPFADKINDGKVLTREEYRKIAELPKFEDAENAPAFLKDFYEYKKTGITTNFVTERFGNLSNEVKDRLQLEMQSKVSLAFSTYKTLAKSKPETITACEGINSQSYDVGQRCLKAMDQDMGTSNNSSARDMIVRDLLDSSLKAQALYDDVINEFDTQCNRPETFEKALKDAQLPACLAKLDADYAQVTDQLKELKRVKEKILSEQKELTTLREFAINELKNCEVRDLPSKLLECPNGASIPVEVNYLAATGVEMLIKLTPQPESVDISAICADPEKSKDERRSLCEIARAPASEEPMRLPTAATRKPLAQVIRDTPENILSAPVQRRNTSTEGWVNGLARGANILAGALSFNPRPTFGAMNYPYGAYSNPYASYPTLTNSLFANQRNWWTYSPTPGRPNFSSFSYNPTLSNPYQYQDSQSLFFSR